MSKIVDIEAVTKRGKATGSIQSVICRYSQIKFKGRPMRHKQIIKYLVCFIIFKFILAVAMSRS